MSDATGTAREMLEKLLLAHIRRYGALHYSVELVDALESVLLAAERRAPNVPLQRVVIACDGARWYTRHLRVIEHDEGLDERVYHCDRPIGNDFTTLAEAIAALKLKANA